VTSRVHEVVAQAGAWIAGALLFALPFLQSGLGDGHSTGALHMDHAARHGGTLRMLGNYHLEVVERDQTVELYVSDAERRPLRPRDATIAFDDSAAQPLAWSSYRLVAARPAHYDWADYRVNLSDAPLLTIRLPAEGAVSRQATGPAPRNQAYPSAPIP